MILGLDISKFQGNINFDILKSNTNFVIIKASEGTGFVDSNFSRNQSEARRVGLPLGYYHFAHPELNSAISEAQYFCGSIHPNSDEVLFLDYEANWSGDPVVWSKTFLDTVSSQLGCKPLIYLNQSLATSHDWSPVVKAGYGLWIAAYTFDPNKNTFNTGAFPNAAMQQWTDKETVPGISGGVDGDVFFGDVNAFKAYGYKGVNMDDTIAVKKSDFENLVSKSTKYDALVADGIQVPADIDSIRANAKEANDANGVAQQEAKDTRATLADYQQSVANVLNSPQDKDRVISAINTIISQLDTNTKSLKLATDENTAYEAQITDLKTEISRLNLLLKGQNPLNNVTVEELLSEIIKRFTSILRRK